MCWRKHALLQIGIILTGLALFLALATWVPESLAHAQVVLRAATPNAVAVQATPTEDATVTALNKEKLVQEVQQLKAQNEPDLFGHIQTNAVLLSTLVVVIGGLIGLFRWGADRRSEREKRAEERFQAAVTGLGDDNELTRINATILLRNFLHPGYERFSTQIFELAVAHLRLPRTSGSSTDPNVPLRPTPLDQKLTAVFIEAFPLARNVNERSPQFLDATGIQLDNAYLENIDLKQVRMPRAFLRRAKLRGADLSGADLREADLTNSNLSGSDLHDALLSGAKLNGANLSSTCLTGARLSFADLSEANLRGVYLSDARFEQTKFTRANLSEASLCRIDAREVDLKQAILREAHLRDTHLNNADLSHADFTRAFLDQVDFKDANLNSANFPQVQFSQATRVEAKLCEVYLWLLGLSEAELGALSQADPKRIHLSEEDLRWIKERQADRQWVETCKTYLQRASTSTTKTTNIEDARTLEKTDLRFAWGLTQEQVEASEAKGAILPPLTEEMKNPPSSVPCDHDMESVLERLMKDILIPALPNADEIYPPRPEDVLGPRRPSGGILHLSSHVRYVSGEYTVKYILHSLYSLYWSLLRAMVPLLLLILCSIFAPNAFSL
jgi:uncharacterized protein YjbI with pentapeptide repeats